MVKRHLFVEGQVKVGKTTLVENFLERALGKEAKMVPRLKTVARLDEQGLAHYELLYQDRAYPIAALASDGSGFYQGLAGTFEGPGLDCLRAMQEKTGLMVIDELGFFESKAPLFQQAVFDLLDNPSVRILGVIKDKPLPFLERIRARKDVFLLRLTGENRDQAPQILDDFFKEVDYG